MLSIKVEVRRDRCQFNSLLPEEIAALFMCALTLYVRCRLPPATHGLELKGMEEKNEINMEISLYNASGD